MQQILDAIDTIHEASKGKAASFFVMKRGTYFVRLDFQILLMLVVLINFVAWAGRMGGCMKVIVRKKCLQSDASPLIALMDTCAVDQFEQIVRRHPEWVNQISAILPEENNPSPLSAAAISDRTNVIVVLVNNGANLSESVHWLQKNGFSDRAHLLKILIEKE